MDHSSQSCPSCGESFPANKIVCTHCNYSKRLCKRLSTNKSKAAIAKMQASNSARKERRKDAANRAKENPKKSKPSNRKLFPHPKECLSGMLMMLGGASGTAFAYGFHSDEKFIIGTVLLFFGGITTFLHGMMGEDGTW